MTQPAEPDGPADHHAGSRRHPWGTSPIIWYRPSIRKTVWRLWGLASMWVILGAAVLGALRIMRVDFGSAWLPLYALGIGLVTAGPLQLLLGLQRIVKIERVLSVHEEGLRWEDGAVVAHVSWSILESVDVTDEHIVIVHARGRVTLPLEMEGIAAQELARTLMDLRRKALMGLPLRLAAPRSD